MDSHFYLPLHTCFISPLHLEIGFLCFSDMQLRKTTSHLPQCQQPRQTTVNPKSKLPQGESDWPSLGQISTLTKFSVVGGWGIPGARGQGHAQLHEVENHFRKEKDDYGGDEHPPSCHRTAHSERSVSGYRVFYTLEYGRVPHLLHPQESPKKLPVIKYASTFTMKT